MTTLYWHDYETWGANPAVDRPSQFAGVRTDEALNIIGEPLVIFCRPPVDVLPHPEACLVTGITPQQAMAEGRSEAEFIAAIHAELAQPGTCGVGYNSLRFDDEVTRYTLYRNFYDPYEREWRDGNSRWDIIDMVRLVYALRPDGIEWPMVEGVPSFRLELLTAANGLSHESAHDAYSDVEATIALARLIRERKPQLYDYVFRSRTKQAVSAMIDIRARKPLLHISSRFPASRGCAALIVPLAAHPVNRNAVIVYDLSVDPSVLETLSAEQIAERVFTSDADLPEGASRIPLKLLHLNKCPVLAPAKMLDAAAASRLGISREQCEAHWQALLGMELEHKVREVFTQREFEESGDPEQQLYGGFASDADKATMRRLREHPEAVLAEATPFNDTRLNAMMPRYKARNFPQLLSEDERQAWIHFCRERLLRGEPGLLNLTALEARLQALGEERVTERDHEILEALYEYSQMLAAELEEGL